MRLLLMLISHSHWLAALDPMLPIFTRLLRDARSTGTQLRIQLFYTRATSASDTKGAPTARFLPQGVSVRAGRPPIASLLSGMVDRTLELHEASSAYTPRGGEVQEGGGPTGVFVGVCGPCTLGEDVDRTVRQFGVREERARSVGGVECQVEVFGT